MTEEREASWDLPADPEFVSKARAMVGETLNAWGIPDAVADVKSIVSELYNNSLLHAESPITLLLRACGPMLLGEITDHGPSWPAPARAVADDENGRGLAIVAELSDRWGIDPLPGKTGKTVWFIVSTAATEAKAS